MNYKEWARLQRGDVFKMDNKEYTVTSRSEIKGWDGHLWLTLFTDKGYINAHGGDIERYKDFEITGYVHLPERREIAITH